MDFENSIFFKEIFFLNFYSSINPPLDQVRFHIQIWSDWFSRFEVCRLYKQTNRHQPKEKQIINIDLLSTYTEIQVATVKP